MEVVQSSEQKQMSCFIVKRRFVKVAVAVPVLLNIIVAVVVIQVVLTRPSYQSLQHKTADLKMAIDQEYSNTPQKNEDNEQLEMKGDTDHASSPSLEFLSLLKPVAHFSGLDFDEDNDSKSRTGPIRNWAISEGSERTLLYNDMTYQNGSITVPVAGVYHITSHVKFYVEDNKKDQKSSQTFHHQIVRYSASSRKQVVLFENVVTECREGINDGAHSVYPSLTGGLAQLDAGDQVIVRVSHFDLLKHDRDWHYFDVYLI